MKSLKVTGNENQGYKFTYAYDVMNRMREMKKRFIIKYCNILDSVFLIDTLGRMPLERIHDKLSVHGLDCNDRETAEKLQRYYENLCGFQRPLFQEVTGFELKVTEKWLGNYGPHYDVYDSTGRHVIGSMDKSLAVEFKEWLEMEMGL